LCTQAVPCVHQPAPAIQRLVVNEVWQIAKHMSNPSVRAFRGPQGGYCRISKSRVGHIIVLDFLLWNLATYYRQRFLERVLRVRAQYIVIHSGDVSQFLKRNAQPIRKFVRATGQWLVLVEGLERPMWA